ncbi:MAG: SWIM zinc finger family protein, partial [Bdellovibrionota bacterium]
MIQARGESYFHQKLARVREVAGKKAYIEVEGKEIYQVEVEWTEAQSKGVLTVECTCPYFIGGSLCKHLWAAILKMDKQGVGNKVPSGPEFAYLAVHARMSHSVSFRGAPSSVPTTPDWVRSLESVIAEGKRDPRIAVSGNETASRPYQVRKNPRSACYRLDLEETRRSGEITLIFCHREVLISGGKGVVKQEKISLDDLVYYQDPADREVLLVLMGHAEGGGRKDVWARSGVHYRDVKIPSAIQTEILQKISTSGKLYNHKGTQIHFETAASAWTLALEVIPSATHYQVRGFFRRGPPGSDGERLELFTPLICLRSGLLIFEDKISLVSLVGQFGWISHLRAQMEILVPLAEGDRLVELIGNDPAAPFVQLPPALNWEQVLPEPKPRLLISVPKSTERFTRMIHAELSFDYAGR